MLLPRIKRLVRRTIRDLTFDNVLYGWMLNWNLSASVPDSLLVLPRDTWAGNAEKGRWLCSGAFTIEGVHQELHGDCWEPVGVAPCWIDHMHGFSWLRDLRACGGDEARQQARRMIESWIKHYHNWHPEIWHPAITGERIANWIALYSFFGESADEAFQDRYMESLMKQARHLSRAFPGGTEGPGLFHAARGLVYAGLAFPGRESWLAQGLDILQDVTEKQILGDGGHISRSPAPLIEILKIFIDIKGALAAGSYPVPVRIQQTIDRMAQALRFFRYADKKFALFNGTREYDTNEIDNVLAKANARGKVLRKLPGCGYHRITVGRSLLMVDAGAPPAYPHDNKAHAAPLAFEFCYGRERIFVNCGTHPLDPEWQDLLRATAAHNTLTIDHRNVCEIRKDGHFGRQPRKVTANRQDKDNETLLEMSHDGYIALNGITHRRRLYLGNYGHDLRGEETLTCSVGLGKPVDVAVRFHLHPSVPVSLIREGREALLRLRGGSGWRFIHDGGVLSLENSIYCGTGTRPRKTKQLVVHGTMDCDHVTLKWALQREG